ncbi:MAG: aldolase catalytic domain-containing protein [bacterium]
MNKIKILDCTLRDGGYINNWNFGKDNIKKIITKLEKSNIDIIECGFLTKNIKYDDNCSKFDKIDRICQIIEKGHISSLKVCMINYGEYDIDNIPSNKGKYIDGIRVAFHKKDVEKALEFCKAISSKGYKLFIQPMVSISYSDEEFLDLIYKVNKIKTYAFYIVDSFGVMKRNDLLRLYYLVDHNLDKDIYVGYHSHNNLQLAFSNAQSLVDLKTTRKLIIDSCVFGMGRGAGNLNTELFIDYLNNINGSNYKEQPLLQIIDQILAPIYLNNYWGYSLPHYISAFHNCHPNYASFLDDKSTLTVENINEILSEMDEKEKNNFNKEYIEKLYNIYQTNTIFDKNVKTELKNIFKNKSVLIIAPGSSITTEYDKISKLISKKDIISISVNFNPANYKSDYVFVSNLRRFETLDNKSDLNLIITSNIKTKTEKKYIVNYSELLNEIEPVKDNAGMMLIKLLIKIGVNNIKIAGIDGYSHDVYNNFADKDMAFIKDNTVMDSMNSGIEKMIVKYSKEVKLEFVTKPKHLKIGDI